MFILLLGKHIAVYTGVYVFILYTCWHKESMHCKNEYLFTPDTMYVHIYIYLCA
jgi:hypothetical protein